MHSWSHPWSNQSEKRARSAKVGSDHALGVVRRFCEGCAVICQRSNFAAGYWALTGAMFIGGLLMLVSLTPTEGPFGPVQKIFFIHLPTAICMFVAAFALFVASAGYLWSRSIWWDDLALASGKVTVLLCTIVLFTGMIWGKSEWGQWWAWSPRLTFSLVLWILYIVYLVIRPTIKSPSRRATISAVYGLAAFIDVPLVYVSVKLIPDIHPSSIELNHPMRLTLLVWSIAIPMMMIGLVASAYSLNRRIRALEPVELKSGNMSDSGGEAS